MDNRTLILLALIVVSLVSVVSHALQPKFWYACLLAAGSCAVIYLGGYIVYLVWKNPRDIAQILGNAPFAIGWIVPIGAPCFLVAALIGVPFASLRKRARR